MATNVHQGVLLKGLPFHTDKYSIIEFFKDMDICDLQITVLYFLDGRHSGLAFVELSDERVQQALSYHCNHLDGRFIEVMPSDEIELHDLQIACREENIETRRINRLVNSRQDRSFVNRQNSKISTTCVYVTGLPEGSVFKNVRDFFNNLAIGHNGVHLMRHEDGTFRSFGYVEFVNPSDCLLALRRNGEKIGESVINVTPCTKKEMLGALEKDGQDRIEKNDLRNTIRRARQQRNSESIQTQKERTPSPVRRRMQEYMATYIKERNQREDLRGYRDRSPHRQSDHHRHLEPRRYSESREHQRYSETRDHDRRYSESRDHGRYSESREHHRYAEARDHGRYSEARDHERHIGRYEHWEEHSGEHYYQQPRPKRQLGPPLNESNSQVYNNEDFSGYGVNDEEPPAVASSQERRIVRLDGLPYEADVIHVREFFSEFGLQHEHVRIQCRDDGSPSGKAFVVFPSEQVARDAVQAYNKQYILGRYVELTLA